MKPFVSLLAIGFLVAALAPQAQARVCRHGGHHTHCTTHRRVAHRGHWHHHHHHWRHYARDGYVVGAPPPPPGFFNPPIFWVDDPSHPFRSPQQWLMDQEGDVPYTTYPVYRWVR